MRLALIPISRAGIIMTLMVGVAVLDAHADRFLEIDRVQDVITIQRVLPLPFRLFVSAVDSDVVKGGAKFLGGAVSSVEIIFSPCAVKPGRPFFTIDHKHIIPLPIPFDRIGMKTIDVEVTANIMTFSLCG